MKAVVIPSYGEPDVLKIETVPAPKPGPEDLLVGVRATALNRGDLLQRRGVYPQPGPQPEHEIPGLEFAGEVEAVGERVHDFKKGDRVMGLLTGGGYAEKVVTHHRLAVRVPESLSFAEAAAVPEAFITAHDALTQARLVCGESLLIHAAGSGVGIATIQIAAVMGASPIMGTAGSDEKLVRAQELGLDVPILYKTADFAQACLDATGRVGADVVIDLIGASYLERNLAALAPCGRMVLVGLMGGMTADINLGVVLGKRLQVTGTVLRSRPLEQKAAATRAFERSVLPHIAGGRIRPIIDRTLPLSEVVAAHEAMERNENFGKIVLEL